jgi:hypothetical protein
MKKNKRKFVIGEMVFITENARVLLGLPDGLEYKIVDILKIKVEAPYVLISDEFGETTHFFFSRDELIKIKE